MVTSRSISFAGAMLAAALCTPSTLVLRAEEAQRQGPHVSYVTAFSQVPSTLEGMWRQAPVVLRVHITALGRPQAEPGSGRAGEDPIIVKRHTAAVDEVLRADDSRPIGTSITILQVGGTTIVNGVEVTTIDSSAIPLKVDQDVIAFLKGKGDYYYSAYADGGLMVVGPGGNVTVTYSDRRVAEFAGKASVPAESIVATLRLLRDRGGLAGKG